MFDSAVGNWLSHAPNPFPVTWLDRARYFVSILKPLGFKFKKCDLLAYRNYSYGYIVTFLTPTDEVKKFFSRGGAFNSQLYNVISLYSVSLPAFENGLKDSRQEYVLFKESVLSKLNSLSPSVPDVQVQLRTYLDVPSRKCKFLNYPPRCNCVSHGAPSPLSVGPSFKKIASTMVSSRVMSNALHPAYAHLFYACDNSLFVSYHIPECPALPYVFRKRCNTVSFSLVHAAPALMSSSAVREALSGYALEFLQRKPYEIFHPVLRCFCGPTPFKCDLGVYDPRHVVDDFPEANRRIQAYLLDPPAPVLRFNNYSIPVEAPAPPPIVEWELDI